MWTLNVVYLYNYIFLGNIINPSIITVTGNYTESKDVIIRCTWKYNGDTAMVAFFDVQIKSEDSTEIDRIRVGNNVFVASFIIPNSEGNLSAVVTVIGRCGDSLSSTKEFMPGRVMGLLTEKNVGDLHKIGAPEFLDTLFP